MCWITAIRRIAEKPSGGVVESSQDDGSQKEINDATENDDENVNVDWVELAPRNHSGSTGGVQPAWRCRST